MVVARLARTLAVAGAVVVLAFYAEILAHAPVAGQDFRNFYAAATVLSHGGNPYDIHQLLRQEEILYQPTTPTQRVSLAGNPYVQGPPVALALRPFVAYAPGSVYTIYAMALGALLLLALVLLARLWPTRHARRRAAVLALSPVTFAGLLLGQPDAILLLLVVAGLWLLARDHAAWAGFALAMGLIKPQVIAGPLIILAILTWRRGRLRRYTMGALAGSLAFVGSSMILAGPAVVGAWVHELAGFGGSTAYTQVDISSLTTLYVSWTPHGLGAVLALAAISAWVAAIAVAWRSSRGMDDHRWWFATAVTGWLLTTPYAHPHDDVLLLPALWYVLDRAPYRGMARVLAVLLFAAWWLLPLTSVLGLRPPVVRGLGIIPVALLLALLIVRRRRATPSGEAHGSPRQAPMADAA